MLQYSRLLSQQADNVSTPRIAAYGYGRGFSNQKGKGKGRGFSTHKGKGKGKDVLIKTPQVELCRMIHLKSVAIKES